MLVPTMIEIDAVVAMSAIFACALAWAQLQTRHLTSTPARRSRTGQCQDDDPEQA